VDLLDQGAQSGAGGEDDGGGRITGHYRPMVSRRGRTTHPGAWGRSPAEPGDSLRQGESLA